MQGSAPQVECPTHTQFLFRLARFVCFVVQMRVGIRPNFHIRIASSLSNSCNAFPEMISKMMRVWSKFSSKISKLA